MRRLFGDHAKGALLLAQEKYTEAVACLKGEIRNPFALLNLFVGYNRTGDRQNAEQVARALEAFNEPNIDQALVVPAFRRNPAADLVSPALRAR